MSVAAAETQREAFVDGAVLVARPVTARAIRELGMRCSGNEIPDPLEAWPSYSYRHAKPDGWWLAAGAVFDGNAWPLNGYGELSAAEFRNADNCTAAFCTVRGRLLAIVSPNGQSDPAIWINVAASRVRVDVGPSGPSTQVMIAGAGWTLKAIEVARLFRNAVQKGVRPTEISERSQPGQMRSFVDGIATAAQIHPGYAPVDPTADAPPLGQGYVWVQESGLGGLYRLVRMGQPTTATSLVDRELPADEQVKALYAIDWVPSTYVGPIVEATEARAMPRPYRPTLPADRVNPPLLRIYLAVHLNGQPASHPVSRYMWPSLDGDELVLEPGEDIVRTWIAPTVRLERLKSASDRGRGVDAGSPGTPEPRIYLTSRRVVAIAQRDPASISGEDQRRWWGAHFWYEWIRELGMIEHTSFKRTMFRARPTGHRTSYAPYIQVGLASGAINEMSFPGVPAADGGSEALLAHLSELIEAAPGRDLPEEIASTDERKFGITKRRARGVAGAIPYSLPSRFQ